MYTFYIDVVPLQLGLITYETSATYEVVYEAILAYQNAYEAKNYDIDGLNDQIDYLKSDVSSLDEKLGGIINEEKVNELIEEADISDKVNTVIDEQLDYGTIHDRVVEIIDE